MSLEKNLCLNFHKIPYKDTISIMQGISRNKILQSISELAVCRFRYASSDQLA